MIAQHLKKIGIRAILAPCLALAASSAAGQASLNSGMAWKAPPNTSYPISCNAILIANPSATSGIYTIDPDDAAGPAQALSVYCDMSYNSGGWTLIAASNGTNADGPVVSSLTSTTTAGVLKDIYVKPLAWRASSIRITSGALSDGVYVISTASGLLSQLRAYQVLMESNKERVDPNPSWSPTTHNMVFNGPPGGGYTVALSTSIYHANGNSTDGLH